MNPQDVLPTNLARCLRALYILCSYENFIATVEDVEVHTLWAKSERKDAIPLLLPHGWPSPYTFCRSYKASLLTLSICAPAGSFYEWHRIIPRLTDPPSDQDPAFHVVCVSQIGFFMSSPPPRSKWSMNDNARIYDKIMVELLGYKSYVAHGGDWVN
jgi:Epoxide hydrolase N terminus